MVPTRLTIAAILSCCLILPAFGQDERIPHAQDKPPGPALTPQQAMAKMKVPEGFTVELIVSEPDIVNPIGMTFDERGRAWITESLEYPRMSAGPGRDRIKILEDTNHDGTMDKVTVFAEGLNIPSGIAVGYGGVWVANSPDILFLQDTDGDDKADTQKVVVTGFGRDDTHELPNSLTWGPDGCLYGLNGVFNRSVVKDPVTGRTFDFTCALFRINPRTHQFDLFAEGTSNPWGVAWNASGDAFLSACVIDHLWHLTETGYYHRQGGPYPPFTWKIESIVSHKHQKAAYCGIHYFDSDAYPVEYRDRLMMGNIHGNCINVDTLNEFHSTYRAEPADDFLSANDAWFMPVVQKTGPDGCLWVLDWYDRYHCYQDARRDPDGIDRLKGRLYRIRYQDSPRAGAFNLAKESTAQLLDRLRSPNVFFRDLAQRVLSERNDAAANTALESFVLNDQESLKSRLHALWARTGAAPLTNAFLSQLLKHPETEFRAWAARTAGSQRVADPGINKAVYGLRNDPQSRVRIQSAIAAAKLKDVPTIPTLIAVLAQSGDDPSAPKVVWRNLEPLLETQAEEFLAGVSSLKQDALPESVVQILPRVMERILAVPKADTRIVTRLVATLLTAPSGASSAEPAFAILTQRVRSGELSGDSLREVRTALEPDLLKPQVLMATDSQSLGAIELATSLGLVPALSQAFELIRSSDSDNVRARMINAVINSRAPQSLDTAKQLLQSAKSADLKRLTIQAIGRIGSTESAQALMDSLATLPAEVQPVAIEALSDRADSSIVLLRAVAAKQIPVETINANQIRKMLSLKNSELSELIAKHWGTVRTDRDPARAKLISQMRNTLRTANGDPVAGHAVFKRVCGQCHKMYGEGAEVGPDITRNGRASFEQILSNVFDPSLVIGAAYQALTVATKDGRVVSGLPIEDSPQRVVLKVQGDKQEIIARADVEEVVPSKLSLMPEGLEKQLKPEEMVDLFAYICLDKPPEDASAKWLPGARLQPGETTDPAKYTDLISQMLPGYTTPKSGEGGIALLADYHGRPAVRTHPVARNQHCSLTATVTIPQCQQATLNLSVAAAEKGDWHLIVLVNGKERHQSMIRRDGDKVVWHDIAIDLTDLVGQSATIELRNRANDWTDEFGYWNAAELYAE